MRKIAIIQVNDSGCYDCDYTTVITHITEWTEVTEEDYTLLKEASARSGNYRSKIPRFLVMERPMDEKLFILNTIADYKETIRKENERIEAEKRKRAEAYQKKKAEDAAKKLEKLKAQVAKLESENKH